MLDRDSERDRAGRPRNPGERMRHTKTKRPPVALHLSSCLQGFSLWRLTIAAYSFRSACAGQCPLMLREPLHRTMPGLTDPRTGEMPFSDAARQADVASPSLSPCLTTGSSTETGMKMKTSSQFDRYFSSLWPWESPDPRAIVVRCTWSGGASFSTTEARIRFGERRRSRRAGVSHRW